MNFLFSDFISAYMQGKVDLNNDKFKLALLNDLSLDELNGVKQDWATFAEDGITVDKVFQNIQESYEVTGPGYIAGGQEITLVGPRKEKGADGFNRIYWTCNKTFIWGSEEEPITLTAYSAILYRVSDGLLIAFYPFIEPKEVFNGSLSINWSSQKMISIKEDLYQTSSGASIQTDIMLDTESTNPVANKVITNALLNLGAHLGLDISGELRDRELTVADILEDSSGALDQLDPISNESLNSVFQSIIHGSGGDDGSADIYGEDSVTPIEDSTLDDLFDSVISGDN